MMQIYVEGRRLALPSDISFEYVAENRLFSNADGYSFDIEIPVKGSPENSEIFGFVWRMEADVDTLRFRTQVITPQVQLNGVMAVVGISETSISLQFLEGRSVQNFEEQFEKLYVNELDLGWFTQDINKVSPPDVWKSFDAGAEAVAIPWVNDNSGNIQNRAERINGGWRWHEDTKGLSFMPYLIVIIRKICAVLKYNCDIEDLENSRFRHLLLCNVLPEPMKSYNYAEALPHWTINEFFENLEIILRGEFDIDHFGKRISFSFTEDVISSIEDVVIEDVVDEFTIDVSADDQDKTDLDLLRNITFADNGSRFWNIHSCDWFVTMRRKNPNTSAGWYMPGDDGYEIDDKGHRHPTGERLTKSLVEFDTMKEFVDKFKVYEYFGFHRNDIVQHNLYYIRENDCYFIFHSTDYVELPGKGWFHHFELMQVNVFGGYIIDPDDDSSIELKTVPVPIDMAEEPTAFLYFSNVENSDSISADESFIVGSDSFWDDNGNLNQNGVEMNRAIQPLVYQTIENGEDKTGEYYDKVYLGFFEGYKPYHDQIGVRPVTMNCEIYDYFKWREFPDFSLRLNHGFARGCEQYLSIDARKCYKFSFLADTIPSPRATFYIKGKRYVCSKITATFSIDGMSKLLKGEFYRY